jgi:Reverse transcriptase (RNA-dependent DNA polymerase)/GAG-pre-integrase domain/Zinc knuckle
MSSFLGERFSKLLSPAPAPPPDPLARSDHTSRVGTIVGNLPSHGGDGTDASVVSEFEPTNTATKKRISHTTPVIAHDDDSPTMGVTKMSSGGTLDNFVGGKPLYDWSGLDPECIPAISPNKYRGESHKNAKDYYYRTKGLDKKIGPKDDLRETCRNVFDHLENFGMDTITYLPDPANAHIMQSVAEKPNMFSKTYVMTQLPKYMKLWDSFDVANDECATKFFLASLNEELLRKVRDTLATVRKPSFILTWMTFVEKIRVISVGRLDGLQKLVESRVPSQYPGQNLETMAAANIRDITDLEQAGWYSLATGFKMVQNFASANSECKSFSWFAESFLASYEAAVTVCFHMNKNECREYMESNGFGYEEICNKFGDYYRKANQDGRWLPTKNARDNHGAPRNFANQAQIRNQSLTQNNTDGGQSKSTCHNCGKVGHWARNCPSSTTSGTTSSVTTTRTSNRTPNTNRNRSNSSNSSAVSWTKVAPAAGESQTKTMHGKTFHWCATCKRWTTSHKTSEHKSKTTNAITATTTPNVSLMATSTNFAAWHVCFDCESVDGKKEDFQGKENEWLDMINTFISKCIFLPVLTLITFLFGIAMATIVTGAIGGVINVIGYGVIAPLFWIATMLLFAYLQPILSILPPPDPPPHLSRWQKRKIKFQEKKERKQFVSNFERNKRNNVTHFHRSYPLRLRSQNTYQTIAQRNACVAESNRRQTVISMVQRLEHKMEKLRQENLSLKAANQDLLSLQSLLVRENGQDKRVKLQKEIDEKKKQVHIALSAICQNFQPPTSYLGYITSCFRSTPSSASTKTVIWDSGSSMSITNDRSEFLQNEYATFPDDRMVTGISSTKVKIQGVGVVSWSFEDTKGNIRTLNLPCLHVPTASQRLLSTSSLLKTYPNDTISISEGKLMLSGSIDSEYDSIQAYIDPSNNLPTSDMCDPNPSIKRKQQMKSLVAVVADENVNLSEPEKELMRWHQRLAHMDCNKVKFLFRTGVLARGEASRSIQTAAAKLRANPRCASCQFGKQCQTSVPTTTKSKVTDSVGAISRNIIRPGQQVSIDHFVCKNKGRLFSSRGKTVSTDMYSGGCLFVDNYSGFVHVELQKNLNTLETLQAKDRFEAMALDFGVIPQTYLSDNGAAFTSHEFTAKMKELEQVSKFAGAGAHHHNGIAERNIRTIISIARTMMIHSAMHWPEVSDVELWPMAVKHAVHVFNRVPAIDTGICPLDKFTRQRFEQSKLHDLHVWGCPVYVLDKRIADGIKIRKWAPRSNRYIYMGVSDKHSSTVPLVLNPESGVISPQFHVVVDEWFATVPMTPEELPDFTQEKWTKMFGENVRHYLWDEDEEHDEESHLPPPQLEAVAEREQRIITAIENRRPPTALPIADPPMSPMTTPTPTQNRFAPLMDDDDDEIVITNDTYSPSSTLRVPMTVDLRAPMTVEDQREQREQREPPVQVESPRVSVAEKEVTVAPQVDTPTIADPTPNLRRSTRERRAPDRLNLYTESPHCFMIEKETFGMNDASEDWYTYLSNALYETTPPITQASSIISADSFKASTGDPDTLSWDQATNDVEHRDEWMSAALKEITALEEHGTWIVDEQTNAKSKILPGTWVFRRKRAPDGTITKYKARYCVRGDLQTEQHETYAPVVGWSTIRSFLILSMLLKWKTRSIDFSQAFVQAVLDYPVWIHLPRGFHAKSETKKCLKLVKSLYGLAEAPRLWYLHLFNALVNELGFTQSKIDACILMKTGMMIVVFVDDCAISYQDESNYTKLITDLRALNFELTEEGEFSKFLGIEFTRNKDTITMTQSGLIDRIAEATGLTSSNPNHTPTQQDAIGKDINGPIMTDTWTYRSIVGMLLYLTTNTRPDIAYAVSQVARFSNNPKQSHAVAVKTIVRYLVGTRTKGTVVTPTGKLDIKLFVDADFAGLFKKEEENDPDSARSRTGYILILGGFPLIWKSTLQTKIALSTLESEYSALSAATRALIPIRELLFEISHTIALPKELITTISSTVFEDNQGAFLLATTQRISARTRYFTVEFHHFWDYIKMEDTNQRKIFLVKIGTDYQGADFLTKGLPRIIFQRNRLLILGW